MRRTFLAAAAAALLAAALPAHAAFPEREITLTVMYGAGGNTDLLARALAKRMEAELGKTIVVMNRPGAAGTLAPEWLSRQAPDGYNICIVSGSTLALTPHMQPVSFTLDDFAFVGAFAMPRFGVAVRADSPYKNMADLIAAAKTGQGIFMGSGATLNSLILTELNSTIGTKIEVAPYKSGAEVNTALLSGQVAVIVTNPPDIIPFVQSGKMRMLASASPFRWPQMPDVPTMKELGMPATVAESWTGIVAPKNTPKDVVAKLEAALLKVANDPKFKAELENLGADANPRTGVELDRYMRKSRSEWGDALKRAKLLPS